VRERSGDCMNNEECEEKGTNEKKGEDDVSLCGFLDWWTKVSIGWWFR